MLFTGLALFTLLVYLPYPRLRSSNSCLSKNDCDRVTSTPDLSTNANALGFCTLAVTRSFAKSTVTMRATNVARASTVWNEVPSTL